MSTLTVSKRSALVGHDDIDAGLSHIASPSRVESPVPLTPVTPSTVTVTVPPILGVDVTVIAVTLFALAASVRFTAFSS